MRFSLSDEQRAFASALDDLLGDADVPTINRSWAAGDREDGLRLWQQLAALGVTALSVPEENGGLDGTPLDVVVAFEALGLHAVPGPWIETVAVAPLVLHEDAQLLAAIADGSARVTVAAPPWTPYAVDCATASQTVVVTNDGVSEAEVVGELASVDPGRTLSQVRTAGSTTALPPTTIGAALDRASLACAAYLLGCAERMLRDTVEYAGQRRQFGRVIGEYQAIKHALADVKVAVDFTRPLIHGAALQIADGSDTSARAASAAKVAAADAAQLSARTALQTHGAIGYTLEHNLGIWMLRTRALVGAWGTPTQHRARVLQELTKA